MMYKVITNAIINLNDFIIIELHKAKIFLQ